MNKVTKAILDYKYTGASMKKQVFICKRSKINRIQDKAFTKLFYTFMEENPVTITGKAEKQNGKYYFVFDRIEDKADKEKSCV